MVHIFMRVPCFSVLSVIIVLQTTWPVLAATKICHRGFHGVTEWPKYFSTIARINFPFKYNIRDDWYKSLIFSGYQSVEVDQ